MSSQHGWTLGPCACARGCPGRTLSSSLWGPDLTLLDVKALLCPHIRVTLVPSESSFCLWSQQPWLHGGGGPYVGLWLSFHVGRRKLSGSFWRSWTILAGITAVQYGFFHQVIKISYLAVQHLSLISKLSGSSQLSCRLLWGNNWKLKKDCHFPQQEEDLTVESLKKRIYPPCSFPPTHHNGVILNHN